MTDVYSAVLELVNFLIPVSLFAIVALGLNLQWGHTGLFNGGVAAFFGIGAYGAAILLTANVPPSFYGPGHWGFSMPYAVAALGAVVFAAYLGLLIAIPILRLRADYFAIATLALAETVRLVITNAENVTGGRVGIQEIPRPFDAFTAGKPALSDGSMALLAVVVLLVSFLLIELLTRLPWGRVLRGIREDEGATLALGKNVYGFRLQAFVLGCAFMGLAGALYASYHTTLSPDGFDALFTFTIYVMVILGGSGNNLGVILGAFLYYSFDWVSVRLDDYLPDWLAPRFPNIRVMIIGAILVAFIIYRPEGILKEGKRRYAPVKAR